MKRMTKIYLLVLVVWLSLTSMTTLKTCDGKNGKAMLPTKEASQQAKNEDVASGEVVLGAARTGEYVPLLTGKRVALLSNQTGMVGDKHTLDLMLENGVNTASRRCPASR